MFSFVHLFKVFINVADKISLVTPSSFWFIFHSIVSCCLFFFFKNFCFILSFKLSLFSSSCFFCSSHSHLIFLSFWYNHFSCFHLYSFPHIYFPFSSFPFLPPTFFTLSLLFSPNFISSILRNKFKFFFGCLCFFFFFFFIHKGQSFWDESRYSFWFCECFSF